MHALIAEPAPGYTEGSARPGIPIGNIGPIRATCLARLCAHETLRELLDADFGSSRRPRAITRPRRSGHTSMTTITHPALRPLTEPHPKQGMHQLTVLKERA